MYNMYINHGLVSSGQEWQVDLFQRNQFQTWLHSFAKVYNTLNDCDKNARAGRKCCTFSCCFECISLKKTVSRFVAVPISAAFHLERFCLFSLRLFLDFMRLAHFSLVAKHKQMNNWHEKLFWFVYVWWCHLVVATCG